MKIDYKIKKKKELSANGLIEIFNGDGKNQFLLNQPLIFDPTNALYEQKNQKSNDSNNMNFNTQNQAFMVS